jgi:hypothetical protein
MARLAALNGNAPSLQPPAMTAMNSGDLLVMLEIARLRGRSGDIECSRVGAGLAGTDAQPEHRLIDIELALSAHRLTGDGKYLTSAADAARSILELRTRGGSWSPFPGVADRHDLSAIWGLPAIARSCLRLEAPTLMPSIWTLGLPPPLPS